VLCGILIAWSAWTTAAPLETAEDDYGRLVEQARQARLESDFETAAADLERALVLRPDSVDALYLLGMVEAYRKRYPEALARLRGARALDPENDDVAIGVARVLSWSGDHGAAEREASGLLDRRPGNAEARMLKARLVYYQGRLGEAEDLLGGVLERDPRNLEALELMGDVKEAADDTRAAGDFYRKAAELAPEAPEIARKLEASRGSPWRFDAGANRSRFSRQERDDWSEGFVQLRRELTAATGLTARIEVNHRFQLTDVHLAVGADHRFNDWLTGNVLFGGTPNADFRERWALSGGAAARLWPGGERFGATLLTLDAKHSNYDTGNVDTLSPGLQQYLFAGRLWLTGRWINTFNETKDRTGGWLGRLDWQASEMLGLYGGAADAGETVAGETVDTRSYFAGLVVERTSGLGLRFDYLREAREESYIRHSFGIGFSQRF
jgi:YaiO family outer membrane protein